ncbi:PH domain-containing protein [Weissella paramesenteroides]|uniref:PH domain-containing protein n=1 Tax=Weissella paramesenteroides TaxID=1249 RepID=UPI0035CA4C79
MRIIRWDNGHAYKSIIYRSISKFATETAGHFDLDRVIKIRISDQAAPSEVLQFKKVKIYQMFNACLQKKFCNFKYKVLIWDQKENLVGHHSLMAVY